MTALLADAPAPPRAGDGADTLADLAVRLRRGEIIPYLGPGVLASSNPRFPTTPEALAVFIESKVALPRRARGNAWAAAQYVESMKHRSSVTALMSEAFAPQAAPTSLHRFLASLGLPLIVDTWYDGAMRAALASGKDWGEIQGITRAGIGEDQWYRFYDSEGAQTNAPAAEAWKTLLYKPHGSVVPAKNFLISDADYVEVLTEIDIQTPIPAQVKDLRATRSFLFLGCRFNDQLLRTYARQVMKRSAGPHYVVFEPDSLSKNEARFFAAQEMVPIALPIGRAVELLAEAA